MKGRTYYHKGNGKYEAYLLINKEKITLGSFYKRVKAEERLKLAQEAVGEGQDIKEWLSSNPNKKAFSCTHEQFEEEYNFLLEDDVEPITEDGYHKKLGFAFTNFRRLQERYEDELEGKTHVVKVVLFMDSSPDLFREKNTVNFRYWKKHLGEIGKQITYNNLHITEFELKMALLKVFQRNIYIPKKLQSNSEDYCKEWRTIGRELDELVQECIYDSRFERKPMLKVKIIYNPNLNLTKKERQKISTEHTSKVRKRGTLEKLMKYYVPGISKRKLEKESGVSRATIRNHWDNLIKQAA